MPLDIPPIIKACHIEDSYILTNNLFCKPISYVTVIFTLFLFFISCDRAQHCTYCWLLCDSVSFILIWISSSISESLASRSAIPACASLFVKVFLQRPAKEDLACPRDFLIIPPPTYKLQPKVPLEVDNLPIGHIIEEFPIMVFLLVSNMKRKLMVGVEIVVFVTNEITHNIESYTIGVIR